MNQTGSENIEELIERTRAPRVTPEQMLEIAAAFEAIGSDRALAHAALTRTRSAAMRGNLDVDMTALDGIEDRFRSIGDESGLGRAIFFRAWALQTTGRHAEARAEYDRCMEIFCRIEDNLFIAGTLSQVGMIENATGNMPAALIEYGRALKIYLEINDPIGIAGTMSNIGTIYLAANDPERAFKAFNEAIPLHEANNDLKYLASTLNNVGIIHYYRNEFDRAIEIFRRVIDLRLQMHDANAIAVARGTLAEAYVAIGNIDDARAILDTIDESAMPDPMFRIDMILARARLLLIDGDTDAARNFFQQALNEATSFSMPSRIIDVHRALRDFALQQNDLPAYVEHNTKLTELTERLSGAHTTRQLAEIEKQRELEERAQELDQHRSALHATLPKHIAERVIRGEQINDQFEYAAVLFADIAGFTSHSSTMSTADVVAFLERIFSAFDNICERHGVVKVKTIGDSYMCFIAEHDASMNAITMARVACEMIAATFTWPETEDRLLMRIGMHIGPVTAGIIGTQRLQYDVWGDTVNVASRMESSGEPGRIHVSEAFASYLGLRPRNDSASPAGDEAKDVIPSASEEPGPWHLALRGETELKGKGTMTTYWLEWA